MLLNNLLYRSIDVMKNTKDVINAQPNDVFIQRNIAVLADNFNLTHIGISIPMDSNADFIANGNNPNSRTVEAFTQKWADTIRAKSLKVLWRGTFCGIEGLYNFQQKVGVNRFPAGTAASAASDGQTTWLGKVYAYIINHPTMFAEGDLWAPLPERTEGIFSDSTAFLPNTGAGLQANYAQFFNDLITVSNQAFAVIGVNMKTGMTSNNYSEVASGWIPNSVFNTAGLTVIDHYGSDHSVSEMQSNYNTIYSSKGKQIYHQEWGDYWNSGMTQQQRTDYLRAMYDLMSATAAAGKLIGFNYWGGWAGGSGEQLLTQTGTNADPTFSLAYNGQVLREYLFNTSDQLVKRLNGQFRAGGRRFKFIGLNKYTLLVNTVSQANVAAFFAACKAKQVRVVRTWAFDTSTNGPLHKLDYPLGTNLISNGTFETDTTGWTLQSGFTRSSEDKHSGSWSIKQVSTSGFNNFKTDPITVTPNTDYILTYWYKLISNSGFQDVIKIDRLAPDVAENNDLGFAGTSGGAWVKKQLKFNTGTATSIDVRILNFGNSNTAFFDDFHLGLATTPTVVQNELGYAQLDMVLDEARKAEIKVILSLMDSNESNYNSKHTYISWINQTLGKSLTDTYPYSAFFTDTDCKNLYKQNALDLINRTNTINMRPYKDDDSIFSWELGNEIRLNRDDPSGINSLASANLALLSKAGGWVDEMSTYIKNADQNHMVAFSSGAHGWQYVTDPANNQDWVWNGTYYGVDYETIAGLTNIDYLDCHSYPTQNVGTNILNFGFKFGFVLATRGAGYRAQLIDYIRAAKVNNKPFILGEFGMEREPVPSNSLYPLYPRVNAFTDVVDTIFNNDGDGVVLWHGEITDGGSFSVNITGNWDGNTTNLNYDDRPVAALIVNRNSNYNALTPLGLDLDGAFGWVKGLRIV